MHSEKNNKTEKIRQKLKIEQYVRCAEDWRFYDKLLWEIPFSTAAVIGAVLAIIYGGAKAMIGNVPTGIKVPLLSCLLVLVITMSFLSRKIRFLQTGRTRFAQNIERNLGLEQIPLSTDSCIEFFRKQEDREGYKGLIRYRTVHFQNLLFLCFGGAIVLLLVLEGPLGISGLFIVGTFAGIAYFWDILRPMYCQKCGSELQRDARFCHACGAPTCIQT